MSSEKSSAIVVRVIDFSETSCVVTCFTRDFGKVVGLAKGARRPKGPFEGAIDLLAVCRIVFLHKSSETLDLLTEAKLDRRFRGSSRGLSYLYAGYYIAELLRELTDAGDPYPELFDEANRSLRMLEAEAAWRDVVLRFELCTLRSLGHMPSLSICVHCGCEEELRQRVSFAPLGGGVLCSGCRRGQKNVISVSRATIEVLREFAQPENSTESELPRRLRGEIRGLMGHYLANLMGRRPRMHNYVSQ
jgi:DNA repair protein RecO (recombination protein O)